MKRKIAWLYDNFEEIASSIFLVCIIAFLFIQVFFRYVVGKSIPWTEELSRFCFLWMVYLCTSLAAKEGRHIRVTAQFKLFPHKIQSALVIFADLIWMIFNVVVVIEGIKLYQQMSEFPLISPVLTWNVKYIVLIIPIAFAMQIIRTIERYYRWVKAGATERLIQYEEEGVEVENVT
ncbi:MAG: TRAP transporter small permease [Peptococcales bacterium]